MQIVNILFRIKTRHCTQIVALNPLEGCIILERFRDPVISILLLQKSTSKMKVMIVEVRNLKYTNELIEQIVKCI